MMQKVRNQAFPCGHSPLPACRHTISGSLNSPHRGSFHLSLAVLVHYRSTGSIQAYGMVPADSGRIARVPPYLGCPLGQSPVSATGLSPSMARLSRRLAYRELVLIAVPLPRQSFLCRFGLLRFRSPLLAESHLLSFPRGTEMFHFPRFARARLFCSARRTAALPAVGFPIRTSPDQSLVSGSPKLIAATRVLLRLLSPRHPSCALSSLVIVSSHPRFRGNEPPRRPRSSPVAQRRG